MKKEKKEVKVTKTEYYYEAVDGTKFYYTDNESEGEAYERCINYENSLKCSILKRLGYKFKKIDSSKDIYRSASLFYLNEDVEAWLFTPETEDDIRNLMIYVEALGNGGWMLTSKKVLPKLKANEKYIFFKEYDSDYCAIVSKEIFDDQLKLTKENFNSLFEESTEEKEE